VGGALGRGIKEFRSAQAEPPANSPPGTPAGAEPRETKS
jgi:hypothetical protein